MKLKPKRGTLTRLRAHTWLYRATVTLIALAIFFVGTGVGNGRISVATFNGTRPVATNLPNNLDYSSVSQVYQSLKDNYDGKLTETQLENGLKHGLAESTKDPYTVYFTADEAKAFNGELNQSLTGIGAILQQNPDKTFEVQSPVPGSPAEKAGLQAKDIISQINSVSTANMTLSDVVTKIRGAKGSTVTLQIIRNQTQALSFTITRDDISVPSVTTKILDGNVGYMQISTFANDTADLSQKAADQFAAAHVKGIVLDLRNDGGGYLDAATKLVSLWLPQGQTILQEKRGSVVTQTYTAEGGDELHGIPTVVLVNGGSASASEITTGALHDNKAAFVIGQQSFGKGVVQQLINFKDGSQLKVTVASWYRPDGENINHKGIKPDQTVTISDDDAKAGTDTQLQAAQAYLTAHQAN